MGFLNKLFGNKDQSVNPIVSKKQLGSITVIGNKIVYIDNENNSEINIDKIEYVYETTTNYNGAALFVYDGKQHYLSKKLDDFEEIYVFLSEKLNFEKTSSKNFKEKKEIYRRKRNSNFQILSNQNYEDYHLGFEIQSAEPEFISWDVTFAELEKNENLNIEISNYDQKMFVFKYPIRIGNIILENFMFYETIFRKDIPVLSFNSDCYDDQSSDKSFYDLKHFLSKNLKKIEPFWERDDSNNCTFNANGMHFGMYYWYDSDYAFNSGYTSFRVENCKDYLELLIDLEYENKISIDKYLIFKENFRNNSNYKTNPNVKRIPEKISDLFSNKSGIWIDNSNRKIGFADKNQSQTFDLENLKSIAIQNVAPAKGGGGCYLELNFQNEKSSFSIFEGNYKELDKYAIRIEEITNKKVTFSEEYNDC